MKDMKEILKRCQACQAKVFAMSSGRSFIIYAQCYNYGNTIDITLFRDCAIEKQWEFCDWRSDKENNAVAAQMEEYIKNLKK